MLTLLCAAAPLGFGPLVAVAERRRQQKESIVTAAADACRMRYNHTLGSLWLRCVVDELLTAKKVAAAAGEKFLLDGIADDEFVRLSPGGTYSSQTDQLMNMLRNYSCEVADGGSMPIRSFEWAYQPRDPCATINGTDEERFRYHTGFLPAGNDLRSASMTEEAAKVACLADENCAGFTFSGSRDVTGETYNILFKTSSAGQSAASGWHSWHKRTPLDCSPSARSRRTAPTRFTVHVLRESPPVYMVDNFVSDEDCDAMVDETVPKMGRSVVGGGGTSSWRQSCAPACCASAALTNLQSSSTLRSSQLAHAARADSVNMVPDFDQEDTQVTRLARRKFAFAREVAGYEVEEGAGQEPINAVYYKDDGDQYRPHCDGECHGGKYYLGSRVASSLTYCTIAQQGG